MLLFPRTSRRRHWPPCQCTQNRIYMLWSNRWYFHAKRNLSETSSKFTYLGSSVSSTEKDIDTQLTKAWTAVDRLSIIGKSDLTDKMKRSFFQVVVVSILLYGCTTWTLTKRLEKKLDGNYTRMLRAIVNKSWQQHPTRHQLYGHLLPITKTIQARQTRHTGHCWRKKDELISDVHLWSPTYGQAKAGRPARTYIQQRWMIGKNGERMSGISALAARHDDDDDSQEKLSNINIFVFVESRSLGSSQSR